MVSSKQHQQWHSNHTVLPPLFVLLSPPCWLHQVPLPPHRPLKRVCPPQVQASWGAWSRPFQCCCWRVEASCGTAGADRAAASGCLAGTRAADATRQRRHTPKDVLSRALLQLLLAVVVVAVVGSNGGSGLSLLLLQVLPEGLRCGESCHPGGCGSGACSGGR